MNLVFLVSDFVCYDHDIGGEQIDEALGQEEYLLAAFIIYTRYMSFTTKE